MHQTIQKPALGSSIALRKPVDVGAVSSVTRIGHLPTSPTESLGIMQIKNGGEREAGRGGGSGP